jgi:hypothetical protein
MLVIIVLTATANTFSQMARIINRGQGKLRLNDLPRRIVTGIVALFSQGRIIRHRRITSLFHYGVALGFIFYLLVDLIDILEGLIPDFAFLEDTLPGNVFVLLADLSSTFSCAVLPSRTRR